MAHSIVFSKRAGLHLEAIDGYLSDAASPEFAREYTARIVERCRSLCDFPERGTPRPGLGLDLRTIPYRRRVTIAYKVEIERVVVLGIYYAGQDFAAVEPD